MDRRDFLKSAAIATATSFITPVWEMQARRHASAQFLALHAFIKNHPEAVFIKKTNVPNKTDTAAKKNVGQEIVQEIFSLSNIDGIPLSTLLAIKPNLTCTTGTAGSVEGMGIRTDTPFLDGFLSTLISMGYPASNMYVREGNWALDGYCIGESLIGGMKELAERQGIHLFDFPSGRSMASMTYESLVANEEVIWKDVANGIVLTRAGTFYPFGISNSWMINIAKFKAHGMGLTLSVKNIQGVCVPPIIHFCEGVDQTKTRPPAVQSNFSPDMERNIDALYVRHLGENKYPRWDRPGRNAAGGYGMETWAQRTCDYHSTLGAGIHIIEGIYGRNGDGFNQGPGPGNTAEEYMSNYIIFGLNPFKVDIIGHWLGGHEPGNFGLFHIAKERGLLDFLNPENIPLYLWDKNSPTLTPLNSFQRYPLKSPYLRRDYNGQNEDQYHLVNEPFNYATDVASEETAPHTLLLKQNYSNPFSSTTMIEYYVPNDQTVLLEVFNGHGERVDILVNRFMHRGGHVATFDARTKPSGYYFYRLSAKGFSQTKEMVIVR